MKFPITKNLSTEVNDIVGYIDIPQSVADDMAACFGGGIGFKLNACVSKNGETYTLRHISIDAITKEQSETDKLRAAARRVIRAHDLGTMARGPSDSVSIEALRELVKE
jgi:hypothetical protein